MSPDELFTQLEVSERLGTILGYIAAGGSMAVVLFLAVVSIKKGLVWFMAIIEERRWAGVGGSDADAGVMSEWRAWRDEHGEGDELDIWRFEHFVFVNALEKGGPGAARAASDFAASEVRKHYGVDPADTAQAEFDADWDAYFDER